jgi:hypothetical protein
MLYLYAIRCAENAIQNAGPPAKITAKEGLEWTYLSQERTGGTRPVKLKTKYEYRTTSVALHASNMVE